MSECNELIYVSGGEWTCFCSLFGRNGRYLYDWHEECFQSRLSSLEESKEHKYLVYSPQSPDYFPMFSNCPRNVPRSLIYYYEIFDIPRSQLYFSFERMNLKGFSSTVNTHFWKVFEISVYKSSSTSYVPPIVHFRACTDLEILVAIWKQKEQEKISPCPTLLRTCSRRSAMYAM